MPPAGEAVGTGLDNGAERPSLRAALEAIMLVVDEPVAEAALADVLGCPPAEIATTLAQVSAEYSVQGRGFELRRLANGWRLYTHPDCADVVERFLGDTGHARLSAAALETLAVVAYQQPVTRGRVAAVRGVNVDSVMPTLVARGLVATVGQDPLSGAVLYRTTPQFLERLGLRSLAELPALAPLLPGTELADDI